MGLLGYKVIILSYAFFIVMKLLVFSLPALSGCKYRDFSLNDFLIALILLEEEIACGVSVLTKAN